MDAAAHTSNPSKQLRIAIIGAGIGGLALAVDLHRLIPEGALKVDIYEQASEIKEIGAGIAFWPRTWPIFEHLGVAEELEKQLGKKSDNDREMVLTAVKGDQPQLVDIFEYHMKGRGSQFRRAAMQKTLMDALPPSIKVHLSHRLVSYDESDEDVVLKFDNQDTQTCDLLVAADGIKSRTRAEFVSKRLPDQQECINAVWSGAISYRTLVDGEKLRQGFPDNIALTKGLMYVGEGTYMVCYPVMKGRFIGISAMVTDPSKEGTPYDGPIVGPTEKELVLSKFSGWSEQVCGLLQSADSFSQWTIQYIKPLRSFAVGRVALLGDAAHAMTPYLAAGAGQAVEDAHTLSHLILKAVENQIPISCVTEAYSKTRQPLARHLLEKSAECGLLSTLRAPGYEGIKDADEETMKMLFTRFELEYNELTSWGEAYPVEKEVKKALDMLQQLASQT